MLRQIKENFNIQEYHDYEKKINTSSSQEEIEVIEKDILLGCFEDFFNAKWQFFSSSEQGTIYNSFNRELHQLGSAFSALGAAFAGLVQVLTHVGQVLVEVGQHAQIHLVQPARDAEHAPGQLR